MSRLFHSRLSYKLILVIVLIGLLSLLIPVSTTTADYIEEINTIDSSGNVGRYNSLTFDVSGRPIISYQDWITYSLKLARYSAPIIENLPEVTISDFIRSADVDGNGDPDFSWTSKYDISFENQVLNIDLNIQLVGDNPGDELRQQWEDGIERIWSNTFDIADGSYRYSIEVEVNWVNTDPHHIVTVHAGLGRADMLNWYTQNGAANYQDEIAAHEAGHMLGLYDEYTGGALNPNTQFTATNSIMAGLGPVRTWHYDQIVERLEAHSGRDLSMANSPVPLYALDEPIPIFSDPQRLIVSVDIKPGSWPNAINLRSKGIITAAILTTSTNAGGNVNFDATMVDSLSV